MNRCYLSIVSILAISFISIAQEREIEESSDAQNSIEWDKLIEIISQDEERSTLIDEITFLEEHPVNLNRASQEELQRIPGMTQLIAFRIISQRAVALFSRVEDLLMIEGISQELFSFIRPFVRVENKYRSTKVRGTYLSRVSQELEDRKGFSSGRYPGSKVKTLNRVNVILGRKETPISSVFSDVELGVLTEKDPGEQRLDNFSAGYALLSIPALSGQVLLGDFQVEAGEGLVLWRASAFSKGSNVISPVRKNGGGIHPYLSTNENSFLKGIAASIDIGTMNVQLWFSRMPLNATIDSMGEILSLDRSGLFRTADELKKGNAARETMIGFHGTALFLDGWKIGTTGYRTHFSRPLIMNGRTSQNVSELSVQGVDMSYTNKNLDVFSEISLDQESSVAVIGGITYQPTSMLALTCLGRKYPTTFLGVHGNAFGESDGQIQNEEGIYVGLRIQLSSGLLFSGYFDQFRSPGATKAHPIPSEGNDFIALVEYKIGEQYELELRYKRKETASPMNPEDVYGRIILHTGERVQENYRLTSDFISSPCFRTSNRIEVAVITYIGQPVSEQGFLASQAIQWTVLPPLKLQARIAVFETNSYDSRIYEFEEDLPGSYSNPALFGRGMRWYFIARYRLFSNVQISSKFSQTIKDGISSFGTGFDEIEGNTLRTFSLQMNIRF